VRGVGRWGSGTKAWRQRVGRERERSGGGASGDQRQLRSLEEIYVTPGYFSARKKMKK
jgi:hypothetical protein